jgi:glutathione S-transferase
MSSPVASDVILEEITINASADRVFDALANPSERVAWWSVPGRFRTTGMESDLRPGGRWSMSGTRADGSPFTIRGEYRIVERPGRLAFTWLPDWQGDATESLVDIEITEQDGATRVRLTHSGLRTDTSRASHRGWPQVLGLLKAHTEAR